MKKKTIKPKGEGSVLIGKVEIGKERMSLRIDATECRVTNATIQGHMSLDFDEFDFDDLVEVFNDGFYTILEHIRKGECDNVQE